MVAFINVDVSMPKEVSKPLLSRNSGVDNFPVQMPIEKQGVRRLRSRWEKI